MTNRQSRRRYRKSADRRVWVFSELNHDLKPEQIAKVLVSAALEQARLEQEARRQQIQALQSEEREAPGEEVTHG
jgi:post-segregation antitoxin (ccd killing protein)